MNVTYRTIGAAMVAAIALATPAAAQDRESAVARAARARAAQLAQSVRAQRDNADRQREQVQRQRERLRQQTLERQRQQREVTRNWREITEPFSRTIRLGRNGTFDLQNVAGNIVLKGDGGNEVKVEAIRRVRARVEADARAAMPEVRIEVSERAGNVEIRTEQPRRRMVATAVDYSVSLPSGANVVVHTVSGDVHVSNIAGELRAESVSGNVTASAVRRVREVRSVSGTIDVSDAESEELSLHTLNGDVLVRNLKGRAFELQTVSGDVRLSGVDMDRSTLESMSGDLEYAGRLTRSGRYELRSHSGNIRVSPSGDPGFDLQAQTFSGDLRSDYALKGTDPRDTGPRRGPGRALRGTFGDASAALTAQSFSGDILIIRK
jgi:DUF4097 and DUF4098 domain-containing protein YvlB